MLRAFPKILRLVRWLPVVLVFIWKTPHSMNLDLVFLNEDSNDPKIFLDCYCTVIYIKLLSQKNSHLVKAESQQFRGLLGKMVVFLMLTGTSADEGLLKDLDVAVEFVLLFPFSF